MTDLLRRLAPSAVTVIRIDHAQVLTTFHQYDVQSSARVRRAIVDDICVSLDIHARIEEEFFYPAMRDFAPEMVDRNVPEQLEWRREIAELRSTDPADPNYEALFMRLMHRVFTHVAEEETVLLPRAQSVLGERRLADLGGRMASRRLQLMLGRAGEMSSSAFRGTPTTPVVAGANGLLAGAYLFTAATRGRGR